MSLTPEQYSRFRQDIGDTLERPAFSREEIDDNFLDEGGDWNKAIKRAIWRLLFNASRFNDYVQNETEEKKSQVFANLKALYGLQQAEIDRESANQQPAITSAVRYPPRQKAKPGCW
jgi:hypothetical protein